MCLWGQALKREHLKAAAAWYHLFYPGILQQNSGVQNNSLKCFVLNYKLSKKPSFQISVFIWVSGSNVQSRSFTPNPRRIFGLNMWNERPMMQDAANVKKSLFRKVILCLCHVSVLYLIVVELQKQSLFLLSDHYGVQQSPPLAAAVHSWTDDCDQKQWNKHQKCPKMWWLICKRSPEKSLFINNYCETVWNNRRAFLITTSLGLKRPLNRNFISPHHLVLVFPNISSQWRWSGRLHKLSDSFYCHHLSCDSQ